MGVGVSREDMTIIRLHIIYVWVGISLLALPAQSNEPGAFALLVGSNRPGEGQETLSFATRDARRFGAVLEELSGYPRSHVRRLFDPSAAELEAALAQMTATIAERAATGEKTSFVFFYSGHARATALNVGTDEIPLKTLRQLLDNVPASFKLIVLDACQTGAISKVKGVSPAADFSRNSVSGLTKEGMAVIASSAASELAQESERLRGSFFTHHLVTALRGAADANEDGMVTLDEAYRYTYNRTLVDTSKTAVGKQHVTLETELSGEGETVLSRPNVARSWIALPPALAGDVLVYRSGDQQIMAEIYKVAGRGMTLALPPADYDTVIRSADQGFECDTPLKENTIHDISLETCRRVRLKRLRAKGDPRRKEHLFFEVGIGAQFGKTDGYNDRLQTFSLSGEEEGGPLFHFSAAAYYSVLRWFKVGLHYSFLDRDYYSGNDESFQWRAQRIGLNLRGTLPLADDWITLYIQAGGGLAFAVTRLTSDAPTLLADVESEPATDYKERFLGYYVGGGGGVQLTPWQYFGFFWQGEYAWAPIIENLIGDTHDSGGVMLVTGMMGGF